MSWKKSWRHPATQQGGGIPPGASQALPDTLLCCLLRQELLFPQQGNFLGSRQQQGGSRSRGPSWLQPPPAGVAPFQGGHQAQGGGWRDGGEAAQHPKHPPSPLPCSGWGCFANHPHAPGCAPETPCGNVEMSPRG